MLGVIGELPDSILSLLVGLEKDRMRQWRKGKRIVVMSLKLTYPNTAVNKQCA